MESEEKQQQQKKSTEYVSRLRFQCAARPGRLKTICGNFRIAPKDGI